MIDPETIKESNPKDAVGSTKVSFSAIPAVVLAEIAVGMTEGAVKYGKYNYREIGVRASIYYDAALRHLTAFWEGEDTDPDSGLSHLVKAITSLAVLRDGQLRNKMADDRPNGTSGFIAALNAHSAQLIAKTTDPKPPFLRNSPPHEYEVASEPPDGV